MFDLVDGVEKFLVKYLANLAQVLNEGYLSDVRLASNVGGFFMRKLIRNLVSGLLPLVQV